MKFSKMIDDNKNKTDKILDDNINVIKKDDSLKNSLIHEKEFLLDSLKEDSLECKKLRREK